MPTTFKDTEGRTWDCAIDYAAAKRVRGGMDVNLLDGKEALEALVDDVMMLVDVIYVVVQPQAEQRGVSDEQFGAALDGDTIDAATSAFLEAFVNFSQPAKRPAMRQLIQKLDQLERVWADKAQQTIESGALDTLVAKELDLMDRKIRTEIEKLDREANSRPAATSSD